MCNALKTPGCETARRLAAAEERVKKLEGTLRGILNLETISAHVGYDGDAGGGSYLYEDAVLLSDIEVIARAALQEAPRDA